MKKLTAYIATILISSPLFAAKISDSQLELGRESAADNKEILFNIGEGTGNPKIRANYSTKKLEFTNDGTNFSEFGTGGDLGGYNIIDNPGFESDLTNWTNTGSGSLSVDTDAADVYQGNKSALWDAAAASDVLASQSVTIPGGLRGNLCSVEVQYKGGDDNLKLQAYDGTNVLAEVALVASANFSKAMVTFTCPNSGTIQGRIIASADAAAVNVDNWVVGKSADILSLSFGNVFDWRTANLVQKTDGTGILDSDPIGTFVAYKFNSSNVRSIDTTTLSQSISDIKANGFRIYARSRNVASTPGLPPQIQIKITNTGQNITSLQVNAYSSTAFGGLITADRMFGDAGSNGIGTTSVFTEDDGVLVLDAGVRFSSETGTSYVGYSNTGSTVTNGYFTIIAEDASQLPTQVQRVETSAWSVNTYDADFYTLPTTTQAEYYVTSNPNATLTNTGSLDAKILCNGVVSTGTTCSGASEMSGIVFDAPRAGKVFICSYFNILVSENSGSTNFRDIFTIFKVPADGSVSVGLRNTNWTGIEDIGSARLEWTLAVGGNSIKTDAVRVCGLTDVVAGSNAFLLATDIDALSGNPSTNQIRGIGFTVFPIEQQLPQAIILEPYDLEIGEKNVTTAPTFNGTVPADNLLTAPMVAAGALVEYGSNSNGQFWRYENGLQIVIHKEDRSVSSAAVLGYVWTFPAPFANSNYISTGLISLLVGGSPWFIGNIGVKSETSATYTAYDRVGTARTGTVRFELQAIGTWK